MWNAYWNWDPRETSIALLLLVYGAYLGLRGAIEDPERRATLSAAYALVAFVTVPVPDVRRAAHVRLAPPRHRHQRAREGRDVAATSRPSSSPSSLAFLALFVWLYSLDRKVSRLLREARP